MPLIFGMDYPHLPIADRIQKLRDAIHELPRYEYSVDDDGNEERIPTDGRILLGNGGSGVGEAIGQARRELLLRTLQLENAVAKSAVEVLEKLKTYRRIDNSPDGPITIEISSVVSDLDVIYRLLIAGALEKDPLPRIEPDCRRKAETARR